MFKKKKKFYTILLNVLLGLNIALIRYPLSERINIQTGPLVLVTHGSCTNAKYFMLEWGLLSTFFTLQQENAEMLKI